LENPEFAFTGIRKDSYYTVRRDMKLLNSTDLCQKAHQLFVSDSYTFYDAVIIYTIYHQLLNFMFLDHKPCQPLAPTAPVAGRGLPLLKRW
jgi:hypothetical protein